MDELHAICRAVDELLDYALREHLVDPEDEILCRNRLLARLGLTEYLSPRSDDAPAGRPLAEILQDLCDHAVSSGIIEEDTVTRRDLFDTALMGELTPMPSAVRKEFRRLYAESPKQATDYFYHLSQADNYIRTDRIRKDEKWTVDTKYGTIDISINLSKPEKDPRDIAQAGQQKASGYPACLLCRENEGYAGTISHPARQNHRVIPLTLQGVDYYLQYSPYVYYPEHCIILCKDHIPMKIDRPVFAKLLEFTEKFPHYTAGSNADLPIVGGSILSHDHFQGGGYVFPMARAAYARTFPLNGYPDLTAGVLNWPMSVIRLQGADRERMADAAEHILNSWIGYTDESAMILAYTDGVRHNTITPIARRRGGLFELDLVLRNNLTTPERPLGLYHPAPEYHHIKKENIGLIEVMGLAILPSRLKAEMQQLEDALLRGQDLRGIPALEKHADWAESWADRSSLSPENIHGRVQQEIGKVFEKVLECAGVYKPDSAGQAAFDRFLAQL